MRRHSNIRAAIGVNCAGCDYSALAEKPIEKGVTMLELTCYRRQSSGYLKPAKAVCGEYVRHHGDKDGE